MLRKLINVNMIGATNKKQLKMRQVTKLFNNSSASGCSLTLNNSKSSSRTLASSSFMNRSRNDEKHNTSNKSTKTRNFLLLSSGIAVTTAFSLWNKQKISSNLPIKDYEKMVSIIKKQKNREKRMISIVSDSSEERNSVAEYYVSVKSRSLNILRPNKIIWVFKDCHDKKSIAEEFRKMLVEIEKMTKSRFLNDLKDKPDSSLGQSFAIALQQESVGIKAYLIFENVSGLDDIDRFLSQIIGFDAEYIITTNKKDLFSKCEYSVPILDLNIKQSAENNNHTQTTPAKGLSK